MIGNLGEDFFKMAVGRKTTRGFLFRPMFTGDKWPTIDFYVEVIEKRTSFYAFFQVKTTTKRFSIKNQNILVNVSKDRINKLSQHLAPTFLICVHLNPRNPKNSKAYIKTIRGRFKNAISSISTSNELNNQNLIILKNEIKQFWKQSNIKQYKNNYNSNF
ncbi:MAG TPA: DUF4365 domain-containing protein [Ignavibacteria bacterium]|nr:DUF4365 domain-containing protein [Ignavibacteria bacterium]